MKKTLTTTLLAILMCICVAFGFAGLSAITAFAADDLNVPGTQVTLSDGDGDGYYEIGTAETLLAFATAVNNGSNSINAELTADIDLTGYEWTIICATDLYYNTTTYADEGYAGIFDGNGYTIKNVTVKGINGQKKSAGLFGTLSGTVKNLGIETFNFDLNGATDIRAGTIAGQIIGGTVSNCYVNGATIAPNSYVVGGIAGCVYDGTIQNCYVVNSTVSGTSGRFGYVVGDSRGDGSASDRPSTVTNCYADKSPIYSDNKGNVTNCAYMSAERFASGEVAGLLGDAFGQNIDNGETKQDYPVLGGAKVYVSSPCPIQISNSEIGGEFPHDLNVDREIKTPVKCTICNIEFYTSDSRWTTGTYESKYENGNIAAFNGYGTNTDEIVAYYVVWTISGYDYELSFDWAINQGVTNYGKFNLKLYHNDTEIIFHDFSNVANDYDNVLSEKYEYTAEGEVQVFKFVFSKTDMGKWGDTGRTAYLNNIKHICDTLAHVWENGICTFCGGYQPATDSNDDGYYEIGNLGQLMWFAENAASTKHNVILTADITIDNSVVWTPMTLTDGNANSIFDGDGHTITFANTNEGSTFGLFGTYNYSFIKNLKLAGSITCNTTNNVGALVNSAYRTTISNVISTCNITNTASSGDVGGLVGYFGGKHADGLYSLIENCAVYADITGGGNVGGLVGQGWDGTQYWDITNAAYVGNVTGTNAGAIIGYHATDSNTCTFTNIYWCEDDGLGFYGKRDTGNQVYTNTSAMTAIQFASGEVAYLLGSAWGQTLSGENKDEYPVLGGAEVPEKNYLIYGQQLNIGADLAMKYYVVAYNYVDGANKVNESTLSMQFIFLGEVKTVKGEYDPTTGLYLFVLDGITPQCMGDGIDATVLFDGAETTVKLTGYTVEKNLNNLLAKYPDDASLVTLINDTLAYGKAASDYKNHPSITENYTGSDRELPDTSIVANNVFKGYTVVFGQQNYIKIKVNLGDNDKLYLNGEDVTVHLEKENASDTYQVYRTAGIAATDFATVFEFKVAILGEPLMQTYSVSVNDYIGAQKNSETMGNLVKALYNYGASTYIYAKCSVGNHCYVAGECYYCGFVCTHDWDNGICTVCELVCTHEALTYNYTYTWSETEPKSTKNYTCMQCEKVFVEDFSPSNWQVGDKVIYVAKDGNSYVCTVGEVTDGKAVLMGDTVNTVKYTHDKWTDEKVLALLDNVGARYPSLNEAVATLYMAATDPYVDSNNINLTTSHVAVYQSEDSAVMYRYHRDDGTWHKDRSYFNSYANYTTTLYYCYVWDIPITTAE